MNRERTATISCPYGGILHTHPRLDFTIPPPQRISMAVTLPDEEFVALGPVPMSALSALISERPRNGCRQHIKQAKSSTKSEHCATISRYLQSGPSTLAPPGGNFLQCSAKAEAGLFPFVQITPDLGSLPKVLAGLLWVGGKPEPLGREGREAFSPRSLSFHSIPWCQGDFLSLGRCFRKDFLTSDLPV